MKVTRTGLPEVLIIEPKVFEDERGWFVESYNERAFQEALKALGLPAPRLVQDNRSCSKKGVLRGLHYQRAPHPQDKLVSVTSGAIFDVAVDIRKESPTFGKWVGVELSANNGRMLWVPAGFAHGFLSLQDNTQVHYKVSDFYAKDCEASLNWADQQIAIEWPALDVELILSEKDKAAPLLAEVSF
ncbi:dTDP-4-dehydrorhamnose 3,5-epimerase [Pseudomonas oryzicola]|uniref:dTDP-4-dehydrorhamnose 3,5-epimerase n=1 Tax=Pseudomonas oryzicola TaxID=485876 RepID=A0ABS6QH94_9PSED|nr:dTDP-4-dehydrorhamnose 3,5-epimerase [Pseudomonas oryzicola]MBV4493372.1 dTDP-4-dehydrorhamnose 3,5-epimerase [Pseudomonas oryzicola]